MGKSILLDDELCRQIVEDYDAISHETCHIEGRCGLKNLGGTCYMNSVLQSLLFTSSLTNYLLFNEDNHIKNLSVFNQLIANEYINLIYLLSCGKYRIITPAPFKQIISQKINKYFENYQQDAHEFLMVLLDYLHTDLSGVRISLLKIYNTLVLFEQIESMNTLHENQQMNYSIIIDLFYVSIFSKKTYQVQSLSN